MYVVFLFFTSLEQWLSIGCLQRKFAKLDGNFNFHFHGILRPREKSNGNILYLDFPKIVSGLFFVWINILRLFKSCV